ncbi:OLC1v1025218C1 [Oldenlandia corymbosa var. corymbosa]|uniref:OLC1v1025218C1 n=1 Tax=Oldenlandia corymbosa var. corymbosa TaxID=529605 RepID=A0AAV1C4V8_OLDCO|nr:OLC1v1025218C1 [Oldenlandia corymbosa var. corymbosa]
MAIAAVIGLSAGKRLLSSTSFYSDLPDKLSSSATTASASAGGGGDHLLPHPTPSKNLIIAAAPKKSSSSSQSFLSRHRRDIQSPNALKQCLFETVASDPSTQRPSIHEEDDDSPVEALLLLQKSMLEKQWNLSARIARGTDVSKQQLQVTSSGVSARRRRMDRRKPIHSRKASLRQHTMSRELRHVISPELHQNRFNGYVKGVVSEELLTHNQVVLLSKTIKEGLNLEEHKARLKKRLGCEPSDEQLASSLKTSRGELQSKYIECSLAREKLAMSNVRLVMSIAQKYDNMGAEMGDLIQGGLIGLLRGIEKYDASKGFRISTYVYWWIRQGVSRALVDSSKTLRLPPYLHERLSLIRNAKVRLEEKGINPSTDRIAEYLNMSQKKVRNATEAICKVISLDREPFPSLNGLPGETMHSYVADDQPGNNPWHGFDEWALKDEVNKLISATLSEREREIICLYYGLDNECLTWEEISKRIGLSRERVRQVGLVALEKLKHAAKKRRLEAMLVSHYS